MALPLLLAGISAAAGILGAGGHLSAKETNEKAQKLSQDAQLLYESEKYKLEESKKKTEEIILKLGYAKKNTLDTSMKSFLNSYQKIKNIQFKESVGINEISKLAINQQGVMELKEMIELYSTSIKSNDIDDVVVLATLGSVWAATSGVSTILGIGGPAALFITAIFADMEADENLEKAKVMYAEVEVEIEKMKENEIFCGAIFDRADMLHDLLVDLNKMFSVCTSLLVEMLKKKERETFDKKLTSEDFTEDELKLIAVTRALAGAVKSIIDTPILTKNGNISYESGDVCYQTVDMMHDLSLIVEDVEVNYGCENVNARKIKRKYRTVSKR